ncbi:hypothetical protein COHA_003010 [Chlorella ohadii]|uniref:Photosynthesis system II assembly factor Ycf48/Hcf136-like domain-containing protein n=1 Tax=Chlorella ohadii TaxID=2649997 RepID=A0AAD5DVR9_9CHLO|nr:hypothetical protein COHA_003010 [Chlorella ohadii]
MNVVVAASASVGYVCGASSTYNASGGSATTIFKTTDGGATWFRLPGLRYPTQIAKNCYALLAPDASTVWAAMADGYLVKSADGGVTWALVSTPFSGSNQPSLRSICSPDGGLNIWALGTYNCEMGVA